MSKPTIRETKSLFGVNFYGVGGGLPGQDYNVFDEKAESSFVKDTEVVCAVDETWALGKGDLVKYLEAKKVAKDTFLFEAQKRNGPKVSSADGDFFQQDLVQCKRQQFGTDAGSSPLEVHKVICVRFPNLKFEKVPANIEKKLLDFGKKFYNELKRAGVTKITIPQSFFENPILFGPNASTTFPLHIMTGFMMAMNADADRKLTDVYCCSHDFSAILDQAEVAAKAVPIAPVKAVTAAPVPAAVDGGNFTDTLSKSAFRDRFAVVAGNLTRVKGPLSAADGEKGPVGRLDANRSAGLELLFAGKSPAKTSPTSADGLPNDASASSRPLVKAIPPVVLPSPAAKATTTTPVKERLLAAIREKYAKYVDQQLQEMKQPSSKFRDKNPLVIFTNGDRSDRGMNTEAANAAYAAVLAEDGAATVGKKVYILDNQSGGHWNFDTFEVGADGASKQKDSTNPGTDDFACASLAIIRIIAADPDLKKLSVIEEILQTASSTPPQGYFSEEEKDVLRKALAGTINLSQVNRGALARKFIAAAASNGISKMKGTESVTADRREEILNDILKPRNHTDSASMIYALQGLGIQYSYPHEVTLGRGGYINGLAEYVREVLSTQGKGQDDWVTAVKDDAKITDEEIREVEGVIGNIDQLVADLTDVKKASTTAAPRPDYLDQDVRQKVRDNLKGRYEWHKKSVEDHNAIPKNQERQLMSPVKKLEAMFDYNQRYSNDLFLEIAKECGFLDDDGKFKDSKAGAGDASAIEESFAELVKNRAEFIKLLEGVAFSEPLAPPRKKAEIVPHKKKLAPAKVPDLTGPALTRTLNTNLTLEQALMAPVVAPVEAGPAKKVAKPRTMREEFAATAKKQLEAQRAAKTLIDYSITPDRTGVSLTYKHYENGEMIETTSKPLTADGKILTIEGDKVVVNHAELKAAWNEYYFKGTAAETPLTTIQGASAIQAIQASRIQNGRTA